MNSTPSQPTTSDISEFMRSIGFVWSNQAQIYHTESPRGYEYITNKTAKRLYKHFIGDKPFDELLTTN